MLTIVILCLIGITVAQQPRPCVSPSQWEGRVFVNNEKAQESMRGKISYDAIYRRIRVIEDIELSDDEFVYDVLTLYDSGLQFIYDLKSHSCIRKQITTPWTDYAIPSGAQSYGEAYIGSSALPDTGVLITIWGGNITIPTFNYTISYISTWTFQGCFPVSRTFFDEKFGNEITSFYDITAGISDPNVFIPRRECLTAREYSMRQVLFGAPKKKN